MKWIYKHLLPTLIFCFTLFSTLNSYGQVWKWAKGSFNPNRVAEAWPITVDASGNVYATSMISNVSGIYTASYTVWGSDTIPNTILDQVIVVSTDSNGNYRWAIGTQGSAAFMINLVADQCGNLYLFGGYDYGTLTLGVCSIFNPSFTSNNYFLAKINSFGSVLWMKNVAVQSSVYAFADVSPGGLNIDKSDNLYLSGVFNGFGITVGTTTLTNSSTDTSTCDVFFAKYDTSGTVIWAKSFGGESDDYIYGLAPTNNGEIYIAGTYLSDTMIIAGSTLTNPTAGNTPYLYIAKFDRYGTPLWAKSSPGNSFDLVSGLATDNYGNAYMVGGYKDTLTFGSLTMPYILLPHTVNYILKFDTIGNAIWGRSLTGAIYGLNTRCVTVDNCSNIWISGDMSGSVSDTEPLFIAEYDTSGTLINAASLTAGGDDLNAITLDNRGNLYVGGDYQHTPFIVGTDTLRLVDNTRIVTP